MLNAHANTEDTVLRFVQPCTSLFSSVAYYVKLCDNWTFRCLKILSLGFKEGKT
jgi:hypothetical protein